VEAPLGEHARQVGDARLQLLAAHALAGLELALLSELRREAPELLGKQQELRELL